jgi:nicotinate-nucleotide adenylyltransferase
LKQPIGIFGGTFDPIHCGHLRTAFELWQELRLAEVRLLPAGTPPHRDQLYASAEVRLKMVRSAVVAQPYFVVDDREVRRTGPSYSVDTLMELRREFPERSLCLLLGMDAFLGLPQWHRWRELLSLAHVVVAHRPGWRAPTPGPLGEVMVDHGTLATTRWIAAILENHQRHDGSVVVPAGLRALLVAGRDPRYLVPEEVRQLIFETRCYAPQHEPNAP